MHILNVSELTRHIKNLFDGDIILSNVFVKGEISNFKRHYSGHCYFTLKDSGAVIKAVMFKGRAHSLKFEPKDGLNIIVQGYITVFERDGQYQLYADRLIPEGVGELNLAYEQLKKKLGEEGLFDNDRKQTLPMLPQAVGIITSPTGAAIRDIITVAKRRHPGIQLILYPVQVQGEMAPSQIAHALEVFNQRNEVDVIIIGRGGGSLEELWAFNSELVVRAIVNSKIPVVSAVGHQTDYTLSDFAADKRAATPSQAAELVIPDVEELKRYIRSMRYVLEVSVKNKIQQLRRQVDHYLKRRVLYDPQHVIGNRRQDIDQLVFRLQQAQKTILRSKEHTFKILSGKLHSLDPLAVLARGYSFTQTIDNKIVKKTDDVVLGQHLQIILHKGKIGVSVMEIEGETNEK